MKVLVTGGAGYIGSLLSEFLLKEKFSVKVIDNFQYNQSSLNHLLYHPKLEVEKIDVRDELEIKKQLKNFDVIIPLAALVGAPLCNLKKKEATDVNYLAIKNIVDNASKDQIIIYPTTNSGYGIGQKNNFCTEETPLNPISLYGKTKVEAENYVQKHQNSVRFRLATVFGFSPRMRLDLLVNDFVYKAVKDKYIVLFEANFKRNYIHIRDVCHAFLYAIHHYKKFKGETFNLGLSDANLSKLELCKEIKSHVKSFEIVCSEIGQDLDKRDYIVSNKKIESRGYKTAYSLNDGIKELMKVFNFLIPSSDMRNF